MSPKDILNEIEEKYGEHIEMAEDRSAIKCNILASLLLKERENNQYYRSILKNTDYHKEFKL